MSPPAPRPARGPRRARRPGQVEQRGAGQLVRFEQPDRPVHAVVPGLAAHLAAAQPGDRLRDHRRRARRQVVERHVAEDGQLRAEPLDHGADLGGDGLGLGPDTRDLAEDLRQLHERGEARGALRPVPVRPVGERVDPVLHADRRPLAASRALAARGARLLRRHPDVAGAVAVEVVLALLGEELDGAAEAVAGAQRPVDREVVDVGQLEGRRLPAEHGRRVRVGVGHEPVPVEAGHPPVHRGVGGQPGLDGADVVREVGVAVRHPVEAGLRAEHGEPRRPGVRGHQVAPVAAGQGDLEQVARVEPEDRPPVGGQVADPGERAGDRVDRVERRRVEQVVHLPRPVVALVDRGDLRRQHEPHRRAARGRQRAVHRALQVRPQPEQPRRVRHQLRAEFLPPHRVREVAGADDAQSLTPGPPGEVLQVAVPAAGAGELGVNVQVRVRAQRAQRAAAFRTLCQRSNHSVAERTPTASLVRLADTLRVVPCGSPPNF